MSNSTPNITQDAVKKFRKAIIQIPSSEFQFKLFEDFPKNCCEYVSYLLGRYLYEKYNYKNFFLITAENRYKTKIRHSWLERKGLLIDITANQFSSTNKTTFVLKNSDWHLKRFKILTSIPIPKTWNIFHDDVKEQLEKDYVKIISIIDNLNK